MRGSPTARRKVIKVEVSKRALWIGAEAYPLQNIARVTTIKIKPQWAKAVGRFVKSLLVTGLLAVAALAVAQSGEVSSSDRELITRGTGVTAAVLVAAFLLQLIVVLLTRTYYALVIVGVAHAAGPGACLPDHDQGARFCLLAIS